MFFTRRKNTESPLPAQNVTDNTHQDASNTACSPEPHALASVLLFNPFLKPPSATGSLQMSANCAVTAAGPGPDLRPYLQPEEAEQEAKIVYSFGGGFAPEDVRNQAGLLEGLIAFTKPFVPGGERLHAVTTEKFSLVVEEVENNYWLSLAFETQKLEAFSSSVDDDTREEVLHGVLRCMYATFRLLHGRIDSFAVGGKLTQLRDVLNDFVPAFVESINARRLSLFQSIAGYHLAPVDRLPYLSIPSLFALLQQKFNCLMHAALLLNGCLVYHSMNLPVGPLGASSSSIGSLSFDSNLLLLLCNYLVNTEGAAAVDMKKLTKAPFCRLPTAAARPGGGCSPFGRAISGEEGSNAFLFGSLGEFAFVPRVYAEDGSTFGVVAICYEQLLLLLLLDDDNSCTANTELLARLRKEAVEGPCGLQELNFAFSTEYKRIMKQQDTYSSNRVSPSDSQPFFDGFCLSSGEVQRISCMHFKFNTQEVTDMGICTKYSMQDRKADGNGDSASSANESSEVESPVWDGTGGAITVASDTSTSVRTSSASVEKSKYRICSDDDMPSVDPSTVLDLRSITMKEANGGWLVGRRSLDRQFYLALDDHKTTFSKAMEDARRFEALHFANIFV